MGEHDSLAAIDAAIADAGRSAARLDYVRGRLARSWDCGVMSYTWRAGTHDKEIRARVVVLVTRNASALARDIAPKPLRLEVAVNAYRVDPRNSSGPVRVLTIDLEKDEAPDEKALVNAFGEASTIADRLIGLLRHTHGVASLRSPSST